jgi:hypothetical protein
LFCKEEVILAASAACESYQGDEQEQDQDDQHEYLEGIALGKFFESGFGVIHNKSIRPPG